MNERFICNTFCRAQLWRKFGPNYDGIVIEEDVPEDTIRERLSNYPILFGVVNCELLWGLSEHDAAYGMENERRREVLKHFIHKHYK